MELQKADPCKTMGMLLGGWGTERREREEREDAINCVKRSIVCDNQNWNLSYHDGTLKVCTYVQKIDYSKPNSQGWKCDFSAWQVT